MTDTASRQDASVLATLRESPLAVKAVLIGVFVSRLSGFLNIFLVLFLTAEGYSGRQAAFAVGVYGVGTVLGSLVGGFAADRLSARAATVVSMAGAAVLTASLLALPSYPLLLGAVCLAGLVAQIYRPASALLLSELVPDERQTMIFAMYRFALNLGATAAPLIGFGLYHLNNDGYTLVFLGEAAFAGLYAVLAWFTLPPLRKQPDAEEEPASGGYRALLADRRYLLYLVAIGLHSAVYVQYLSTLPLAVSEEGVAILWYTLAVSLNGLVVIAFELPLTKVTQRRPRRLTIAAGFVLIGAGVAFYGLPLGAAVILIGTLIWSLGEIIGGPAAFAYPAAAGPAHLRGRYLGSFHFMFGLGAALGPVIGAWALTSLGQGAWPVLALGALAAAGLSLLAVRPEKAAEIQAVPVFQDPVQLDPAPLTSEETHR